MAEFDLVVRGGTVATASDTFEADIAVNDGQVVALGLQLGAGREEIDAAGRLVLPGGVEAHCHIEQESSMGMMCADDFASGSISAAFGGNTTIVPFAAQHRGQSLRDVVDTYRARAEARSVLDFACHLIISDPTEHILGQELPALIMDGYTSFKVYMTYELLKVNDRQLLDVLATARRYGAMTMVHAENNDVINWMTERLLAGGHSAPKYHAMSHARIAESEAANRAISMAELVDTPMLIVHVSTSEAAQSIRHARGRGLKIYGETCPQYLFLTAEDLDKDGMDGAKFCCSPPPRDSSDQEAMWLGLANDTFQVFSSDHAPYRFDDTGKLKAGPNASFKQIANGVPGIELRLPLLFSEGVRKGRISLQQFVSLTATNAAKIYGLHPRKGTIAVGSDADLVLWDPQKKVTVTYDILHDNVGYTPYEGMELEGWPEVVINRGRTVVSDGALHLQQGDGAFIDRKAGHDAALPTGKLARELDVERNFGASIL
ncbi:MAG: dihydropyrimidinase [Chromatiales bacterium]|jgi:dihydropyrimidinase|nr:dihydropyrimidinase [Chromatiales bacterium]